MLIQTQQNINTDIIFETIMSNNKQLFLALEIIFINKPYTVNKSSYYKMFINLNLNPNIMNDSDYQNIFNLTNLDFKLYSSDLKEIKPVQWIPKTYKIRGKEKTYFEYQLSTDLKKDHVLNLNFGFTHDYNQVSYKSKGEIRLNPEFVRINNKININVVSCLNYYDYYNNSKILNLEPILQAKVLINSNPIKVNQKYKNFFNLDLKFNILNSNDSYKIVYTGISQLNENKKIVDLKTGKGDYF